MNTKHDIITTGTAPAVVYHFTAEELRQRLSALPDELATVVGQLRSGEADPEWVREQAITLLSTGKAREAIRVALAIRRTLRGDIEAQRKDLKAGALAYGREVDSVAKGYVAIVEETEQPLKMLKQAYDDEKERIKREAEAAERIAREDELRVAREAEEARLCAEREAEEQRIAEERAALEAERAAMAAAQARVDAEQRAERDRLEAERARLKAERDAQEAAQRAEQERRDAEVRAEQERLEAERRDLDAQRRQAEREEAERQAKVRAEQEAKERAERERVAAEEAAVREKERQAELARRLEALRPDKEKALVYVDQLLAVAVPEVVDEDLADVLSSMRNGLSEWREDISRLGTSEP